MNIYILSDLHDTHETLRYISELLTPDDVLLIAGDFTTMGDQGRMEHDFKELLEGIRSPLLAVHGNMDHLSVRHWLELHGYNIDREIKNIRGWEFFGLGGSTPCPCDTPTELTEDDFRRIFKFYDLESKENLVFVIHQPPYGTALDTISSGIHVGSHAVREAILEYQPVLSISGHIHESRAIDKLGETIIVNPGPAASGYFAVFDSDKKECYLRHINDY